MRRWQGFTLIEMVISIILLSIVGLFLGEVIRQSLVLYSDTSTREALVQQGRFVTERLRREIRESVPNSVIVEGSCIEILPIINSGLYMELASPSAASSSIRVLPLEKTIQAGERLVVYPTNAAELRDDISGFNQIAEVASDVDFSAPNDIQMVNVSLAQATGFKTSSPAKRVYFYRQPVAFCQRNSELYRYEGYPIDRAALTPALLDAYGVKVAENVSSVAFAIESPKLQRNGLVKMELTFSANGEEVRFDHDALIYNTP